MYSISKKLPAPVFDWLKLEQGQLVSPFKEYLVNNYYYMYYYIIQLI